MAEKNHNFNRPDVITADSEFEELVETLMQDSRQYVENGQHDFLFPRPSLNHLVRSISHI